MTASQDVHARSSTSRRPQRRRRGGRRRAAPAPRAERRRGRRRRDRRRRASQRSAVTSTARRRRRRRRAVDDDGRRRRRRRSPRPRPARRVRPRRALVSASATSSSTRSSACRPTSRTTASGSQRAAGRRRRPRDRRARRGAAAGARRVRRRAFAARRRRQVEPIWSTRCSACCSKAGPRAASTATASRSTPTQHEAVMHEPGDGDDEPVVSEVLRTGYTWKGRVAAPGDGEGQGLRRTDGAAAGVVREGLLRGARRVRDARRQKEITKRVPQARHAAPPRRQPGRRRRRGALQGDLRRLRRARRRREAQGVRRGPAARPDGVGLRPRLGWRARRPGRASRTWATAATSATSSADLFGRVRPRRTRRSAPGASARSAASDLEAELHLAFDDAVQGVTTTLHLTSDAACSTCSGTGAEPGTHADDLPGVRRPRRDRRQPGPVLVQLAVPQLRRARSSSSTTRARPVAAPASSGAPREVKVRIPAGVDDGQRIRLKGRGGPGRNGGPPGDLYVVVHVAAAPAVRPRRQRPHARACRSRSPRPRSAPTGQGADARRRPGDAQVSRRARSRGRTFRVKGKGVVERQGDGRPARHRRGRGAGAARATSERKAVEALAEASDESPRAHLGV